MTNYQMLLTAADKARETARDRLESSISLKAKRKWQERVQRLTEFQDWLLLSINFNPEARV
jgi:hypothetical protein